LRYGGHTSCVALSHDDERAPSLLLDGGTGLQRVAAMLDGNAFSGSIVLSHLHWDHVQGLPFFSSGDRADSRVEVLLPEQSGGASALDVLAGLISPPYFPIAPTKLRGDWSFQSIATGESEVAGFSVLAREIPHKGGRTFGYRVQGEAGSVAYLPDHSPLGAGAGPDGLGAYHQAAMTLADGVDLLIHDAQHTAEELPAKAFLGHSAVEYAVGLGAAAGARQVALFHHDPGRSDREVDAIVASLGHPAVRVFAAREGMHRQVGGRR
jgi:phosphoribosyl 1,2-cyclic phosphodiesterase